MNMKKIISLIFVCFFCLASYAEVVKWRTNSIAYRFRSEDTGQWQDWGDWEECKVLILVDLDRDVIRIYSQETQEYDVISDEEEESDSESTSFYYNCIDKEGNNCQMRLRVYNDPSYGSQLYVAYDDVAWVYAFDVE